MFDLRTCFNWSFANRIVLGYYHGGTSNVFVSFLQDKWIDSYITGRENLNKHVYVIKVFIILIILQSTFFVGFPLKVVHQFTFYNKLYCLLLVKARRSALEIQLNSDIYVLWIANIGNKFVDGRGIEQKSRYDKYRKHSNYFSALAFNN